MKVSMSQLDNCRPNLNDKSMHAAIKSEMAVFERSGSCARPQCAARVLSLILSANIRRGRAGFFLSWAALYQNKIVPRRCHVGHTAF